MDKQASAFDPIATAQVEELIDELRTNFAVVIVAHSIQQAARVGQRAACFHSAEVQEYTDTGKVFTKPDNETAPQYLKGRVG